MLDSILSLIRRPSVAPPDLNISHQGIIDTVGTTLLMQRQAFQAEGGADSSVATTIERKNLLETEQVHGAIRGFVGAIPGLKKNANVFPVYNADCTALFATNYVIEQMQTNPFYARLENNKLRQMAKAVLSENGFDEQQLFLTHLKACHHQIELWQDSSLPTINSNKQWVLPIRTMGNHYVLLLVHFMAEDSANIQYYNSLGNDINPAIKDAMISYLQENNINSDYQPLSKKEQNTDNNGDNYNCGVFIFRKAAELLCRNGKLSNPFGDKWEATLHELRVYRYIMAKLLSDVGQNVSIPRNLIESQGVEGSLISPLLQAPLFSEGILNPRINRFLNQDVFSQDEEDEIREIMEEMHFLTIDESAAVSPLRLCEEPEEIPSVAPPSSAPPVSGWLENLSWQATTAITIGVGALLYYAGAVVLANPLLMLTLAGASMAIGVGVMSLVKNHDEQAETLRPTINLVNDQHMRVAMAEASNSYTPQRQVTPISSQLLTEDPKQQKKATYRG